MADEPIGGVAPRRGRKRLYVLAALLGCGVLALALFRNALFTDEEKLLLLTMCNGVPQLFSVKTDGSDITRLSEREARSPATSPDGKRVAFVSTDGLYVVGTDGTRERQLTKESAADPAFSPDGKTIVYAAKEGEAEGIRMVSADGGTPQPLIRGKAPASNPVFSPDGTRIAYVAGEKDGRNIFVADADGSHVRPLTTKGGYRPVFDPKGARIAFLATRENQAPQIYVITPEGTEERRITGDPHQPAGMAFSPNGGAIAFLSKGNVYRIGADGKGGKALTTGATGAKSLSFSPDGSHIVFATDGGVRSIPVNGGKVEQISDQRGNKITWTSSRRFALVSESAAKHPLPEIPSGYTLTHQVEADFDDDGKEEIAIAIAPTRPRSAGEEKRAPLIVMASKNGRILWQDADAYADNILKLHALDVTGDGVPELLYSAGSFSADGGYVDLHVRQWRGNAFASVIGTEEGTLSHVLEGGVVVLAKEKPTPATLLLYGYILGENEANAEPHRFWTEWYRWKEGEFVLFDQKETHAKYKGGNPLKEFGIELPKDSTLRY